MGTRGLTCVVLDGEYRVGQYGQWDHYPEGQGATILNFLTNNMDREKFEAQLRKTKWITEEEHTALWDEFGGLGNGFVSMDKGAAFKAKHPQLDRDMGGDILEFIQSSKGEVQLQDSSDFATDDISCEYVYVVNLDHNVFDVYVGTADLGAEKSDVGEPTKSFSLSDLPTEETFVNSFKDEDELREDLADSVDAVLTTLRQPGDDAEAAHHVANYIEANMDDFLESIHPEG